MKMGAFALVCLLAAAILLWLAWPEPIKPVTPNSDAVVLTPAVQNAPTEPVVIQPGKPPVALKKTPKLRKVTKIPAPVLDSPTTSILATGRIQADEGRAYTTSAVFDSGTGRTSIYAAADPLPWLAFPNRGRVGLGHDPIHGVSNIHGSYDAVQSKSFVLNGSMVARTQGKPEFTINLDWKF
jgi:hypothetical protein